MEKKMSMEIGSIYEIDPETVKISLNGKGKLRLNEAEKYGKKYIKFTGSGREAIALALRNLEDKMPDIAKKCLLPAYMCDTVFFPFQQAGWELHFYHVEKNLQVQEDELRRQMEYSKPGLLFIHPYYGVDTWSPMRSLLKEWQAQGVYIMEDVTQSYYLREAGVNADYIIGSLRKWYPIPDGGFVSSDIPFSEEEFPENGEFVEKRLELLTEKWKYLHEHGRGNIHGREYLKENYLRKNREMEEWLDTAAEITVMSEISAGLLGIEEEAVCRRKRNENYRQLFNGLKAQKSFCHIFHDLREIKMSLEDAAPLYFCIYARERDALQEYLREHDIYAPVLWPVGRENKDCLSESERYIYGHLLALPMDQRYGRKEMERIIDVMNAYERTEYI